MFTVRDYQARVNALLNEERLVIDGMSGPNTRRGIKDAMDLRGVNRKDDLFHSSGLHRINLHWTASTYNINSNVLAHYNDVFDYEGNHYDGASPAMPEKDGAVVR